MDYMDNLQTEETEKINGGGWISDLTAMITEALVCGCDMKVPKHDGQSWNEYNNKF